MSNNHLMHLLNAWLDRKDDCGWVLGTVFRTQGSAYRKAGSYMLFNDLGEQYGLLSGGCLESDLYRKAMHALQSNQSLSVCYDSSDAGDVSYKLGIGCGGIVDVLLQPVTRENDYLLLDRLHQSLTGQRVTQYRQSVSWTKGKLGDPRATCEVSAEIYDAALDEVSGNSSWNTSATLDVNGAQHVLTTQLRRPPHIAIFGGGIDARPLATMAAQLGWQVTVLDPRPANARKEHFADAYDLIGTSFDDLHDQQWGADVDAAVVMCHNVQMDADALTLVATLGVRYCALLGPRHRTDKVLEVTPVSESDLPCKLCNPAGLPLGGDLPESIALSILAECHRVLYTGE